MKSDKRKYCREHGGYAGPGVISCDESDPKDPCRFKDNLEERTQKRIREHQKRQIRMKSGGDTDADG